MIRSLNSGVDAARPSNKLLATAVTLALLIPGCGAGSTPDQPTQGDGDSNEPVTSARGVATIRDPNEAPERSDPAALERALGEIRAALTTSNGIGYNGGPVMTKIPNIYVTWYGSWSGTDQGIIRTFINDLGGSHWYRTNSTYTDGAGKNIPDAVAAVSKEVALAYDLTKGFNGKKLTDADIRQMVTDAIRVGNFPSDTNGVYFVFTASDVTESRTSSSTSSKFCGSNKGDYCGYHDHLDVDGADIKYSFIGDPTNQCFSSCSGAGSKTTPNGSPGPDAMVSVIFHELSETVSDPDLNAWADGSGNENADKCAWKFGTKQTLASGAAYNTTILGRQYLLQQQWVNAIGGACVSGWHYYAKTLSVSTNADGRQEVFYADSPSQVLYHDWQTQANGDWSGEHVLEKTTNLAKQVTSAVDANGRVQVVYIGTNDVLYTTRQSGGGLWTAEATLGTSSNKAKQVVLGTNQDGRLEAFYVGANNVVYHNWQTTPGGSWSGEAPLQTTDNLANQIAVATNSDGRLEVFYLGTNNVVYHNYQTTAGGSTWSGELPLQTTDNQGLQIAVGKDGTGRLGVFYVGTDQHLYYNIQSNPGNGWDGEQMLGTTANLGIKIAVGTQQNGRFSAFYIGTNNVLYRNDQGTSSFTGEVPLGTTSNKAKQLVVGKNQNGTLEAFYIGTNDALYHNYQMSPSSSRWSGEYEL